MAPIRKRRTPHNIGGCAGRRGVSTFPFVPMSWWKRQPAVPDPAKEAAALLRAFRAELGDRYSLRPEDLRNAAEGLIRRGAPSVPVLVRHLADPLKNVRWL